MRPLGCLVALAVSWGAANAQTGLMPVTDVTTPNEFIDQLPASGARVLPIGLGEAFEAELRDRDVAGVFDDTDLTTANLLEADVAVQVVTSWETAEQSYREGPLAPAVNALPPVSGDMDDIYVRFAPLTLPDGGFLQVYTFLRSFDGDLQDDACFARFIIDHIYRGSAGIEFDSVDCTESLE
ncbi:hypothetical protein [Gymnodinialimonas sp. 57CJ19]|uniref:hypothetical protein n=1 Tax=Gymnodinialimonas sp. 57CJ19 TaxID=3138498 RepID=UPI0031345C98